MITDRERGATEVMERALRSNPGLTNAVLRERVGTEAGFSMPLGTIGVIAANLRKRLGIDGRLHPAERKVTKRSGGVARNGDEPPKTIGDEPAEKEGPVPSTPSARGLTDQEPGPTVSPEPRIDETPGPSTPDSPELRAAALDVLDDLEARLDELGGWEEYFHRDREAAERLLRLRVAIGKGLPPALAPMPSTESQEWWKRPAHAAPTLAVRFGDSALYAVRVDAEEDLWQVAFRGSVEGVTVNDILNAIWESVLAAQGLVPGEIGRPQGTSAELIDRSVYRAVRGLEERLEKMVDGLQCAGLS